MNAIPLVRSVAPAPGIFEIRLGIPERLNAIDEEVLAQLNAVLDEAEADPTVRALLIGGDGRAFCAGANYKKHVKDERTMYQKRQYVDMIFDTYRRIHRFDKPVVAAVQGIAAGAGAELAVNCDFILMADDSELWFPEIGVATFIGCGVTVLLPRLIGLARARPETERVGILGIATTRGDRLFLSLVLAAVIHLAWIGLVGAAPLAILPIGGGIELSSLWLATVISLVAAAFVFRMV